MSSTTPQGLPPKVTFSIFVSENIELEAGSEPGGMLQNGQGLRSSYGSVEENEEHVLFS